MDNLIECPYNRAHQIRPERMQYHLIKCRKQFPEKALVICPFNATHHMSKHEERNHMLNCPDRRIVDIQRYRFNEPLSGHHGDLSNPKVYGSSRIPKEETGPPEGGVNTRPRSRASLGRPNESKTSMLDTTSASSIGKDYLRKAGKVDFLHNYLLENERPGFGTAAQAPKKSPGVSRRGGPSGYKGLGQLDPRDQETASTAAGGESLKGSAEGGGGGSGLSNFQSMASALAETRAGRRRATSAERKPLRRPKPEAMAAAAARTAAIEGTTAQDDNVSTGSGFLLRPRSRPLTPTTSTCYISDRG